ncbi:MAG TPA: hypothetical protein VIA98_10295 [Allosphingosinicella sp.]|jgi:hypothetical protein
MLSILCGLGGHEAAERETYNSGYYFSRCRRCRCDMVRTGAAWRAVPRGHKVVWKGGCHSHSLEPDYAPVLPTVHRDSNLPAVRSPFASWARQLIGSEEPVQLAGARVAVPEEEPEERAFPYLLAFAAVIGAGLQMMLSLREVRGGF